MSFCPFCNNLLFVKSRNGKNVLACNLCPIFFPIKRPILETTWFTPKPVDMLILGSSEAFKNCNRTAERCPKCSHPDAYFLQIQTRSADEPMTNFYRCCNTECNHTWRD